jgi:hypothetical protein
MLQRTNHVVEPFEIRVSDAALDDLTARLKATRWLDAAPSGWTFGIDDGFMREVVDRWANGYRWRAHEALLNARKQYKATAWHAVRTIRRSRANGRRAA